MIFVIVVEIGAKTLDKAFIIIIEVDMANKMIMMIALDAVNVNVSHEYRIKEQKNRIIMTVM